ncbi:hypothetical protein GN244_ATG10176 [Phytophthora infestans]|uniref:Uncharacterized protein n=1 Tax=Phytophthora infestans TaxID=4787 RepID=A0A833WUG1_PHYIN|nr:hypothetical protein GN244_ATG10176 [Phytophthora infestans]
MDCAFTFGVPMRAVDMILLGAKLPGI